MYTRVHLNYTKHSVTRPVIEVSLPLYGNQYKTIEQSIFKSKTLLITLSDHMKQIQEAKHVSVSKAIVRLGDITAEWTSAGSVEETASVFFFS